MTMNAIRTDTSSAMMALTEVFVVRCFYRRFVHDIYSNLHNHFIENISMLKKMKEA